MYNRENLLINPGLILCNDEFLDVIHPILRSHGVMFAGAYDNLKFYLHPNRLFAFEAEQSVHDVRITRDF